MTSDALMTARLREALKDQRFVDEKRMMGGVCFMVNGHMIGGARVHKDGQGRFMFRVGKDREAEALSRPGAVRVVMGKRAMPGFIRVLADQVDDAGLASWIALALSYIKTLPPKGET